MSINQYIIELNKILSQLFKKYTLTVNNPGILLSGGIDSTTLTYLVSKYFKVYHIFTMGTKSTKDKYFVDIVTNDLQKKYDWINIDENELKNNLNIVKKLLNDANIKINVMQLSLAAGYYFSFKSAQKLGIKYMFTGQGPDILMAGYHKYKSIKNINAEIKKDLPLLETDKKRDKAMADYFGIELINPYLEKEVIDFCLSLPQEYKIKDGIEKYLLRQYAQQMDVPDVVVNRPKKAFQYSTGIQKLVMKFLQ